MSLPPGPEPFCAHSAPDGQPWERLYTSCTPDCPDCAGLNPRCGHLNKVARLAAFFSQGMFAPKSEFARQAESWGYLAGLWHDLGKFSPIWQAYLRRKAADLHSDDANQREDHSSAGAIHAQNADRWGELLAYLIAGHHAGLDNGENLFQVRLPGRQTEWAASLAQAKAAGFPLEENLPMPPLGRADAGSDGLAFMMRFFFSCLADADFLATEAFMQPDQGKLREPWPDDVMPRLLRALESHLKTFEDCPDSPVNRARETVRRDCEAAAENLPGFFSLTVPTGGGKTLSSMLFALRHAVRHGLRRVIYVIPFTSIIRQNAEVFREAWRELSTELGREIVLEHHSKFEPALETTQNRLAAENWDAPIVVTTNVQFFESLFANRPGACRKLHRIARSVVILDEVQSLPPSLMAPSIRALRGLVHDLNASVVLCTATQPALDRREGFPIGIPPEEITPIIQDEPALFQVLERVRCENLGKRTDVELLEHVRNNAPAGCLMILNTTKAARAIFHALRAEGLKTRHLSARMCPVHVMKVLDEVKRLRKDGAPVFLVSTQLIEAGVDVDFPVVYRAECGLDSFAQAAGRCNRNGELPELGRAYWFEPVDHPIPKTLGDLAVNAGISHAAILPNFPPEESLSLKAIRAYFEQAIWQAGPRTNSWDKPGIISECFPPGERSLQAFQFRLAAERFRLIDSATHAVLIPWDEAGRKLKSELKGLHSSGHAPNRGHYRRAQAFTVQVYEWEWELLQVHCRIEFLCDGSFAILIHPENDYDPETGLKPPDSPDSPNAFMV